MPTRRAVLTGALALGVLAGCTDESPVVPAEPDPDAPLAAELLAAQQAAVLLLDAAAAGKPARVEALAATRLMHASHIDLLAPAVPTPATIPVPAAFAGPTPAAYAAVAGAEDQLGQRLRAAALRAQSGPFARVIASMAAATAQESVRLRGLR